MTPEHKLQKSLQHYNKSFSHIYRGREIAQKSNKTPRNSPCPCGSGKKYKRCCLKTPQ